MDGEGRSKPKRCVGLRKDGSQCNGLALGSLYCFAHDPARAGERVQARRKGGRNSAKIVRLRGLAPPRLRDLFDVLEVAVGEVHGGALAPPAATAMAALARAMVAVLDAGDLAERVAELEQAVSDRGEKRWAG